MCDRITVCSFRQFKLSLCEMVFFNVDYSYKSQFKKTCKAHGFRNKPINILSGGKANWFMVYYHDSNNKRRNIHRILIIPVQLSFVDRCILIAVCLSSQSYLNKKRIYSIILRHTNCFHFGCLC